MLSYGTVSVLIVMSGFSAVNSLMSASNAAFSASPDQLTKLRVTGPPPVPLVLCSLAGRVSPAHPLSVAAAPRVAPPNSSSRRESPMSHPLHDGDSKPVAIRCIAERRMQARKRGPAGLDPLAALNSHVEPSAEG